MKYPALLVTALAVTALACKGKEQPVRQTQEDALAAAAATKSLPAEHYVSPTEKFDIALPGAWTGKYRATEKKDTTMGARLAVEFKFIPDSGSKAPSLTLMTMRIVPKKTWDALVAKGGAAMGAKIGERGDEVFVLSLPSGNPYPAGSREAPAYDNLIISIAQGGQQVHITTRP